MTKEHDFGETGFEPCAGCGRYLEECLEHRYCTPREPKLYARNAEFDEAWNSIVSGWLLICDFDDVTERIERLAALMTERGVKLGELDELKRKTVELMIRRQIALGDTFDFPPPAA